jgi:hypothetical protein
MSTNPRATTFHTFWRVYHKWYPMQEAYFGPEMQLDVTESSQQVLLHQSLPACDGTSHISWTFYNTGSGNTIACTSSGLRMQLGSGLTSPDAAPRVDMQSDLPAYTSGTFHLWVHVHFEASSSTTYAGFATHTNWPGGCTGRHFEVRPDGAFRVIEFTGTVGSCKTSVWSQGTIAASRDYDLYFAEYSPYGPGGPNTYPGGQDYYYLNGNSVGAPGTGWLGPDGLIVEDPTGASAPVTFSTFEVSQATGTSVQFQVP